MKWTLSLILTTTDFPVLKLVILLRFQNGNLIFAAVSLELSKKIHRLQFSTVKFIIGRTMQNLFGIIGIIFENEYKPSVEIIIMITRIALFIILNIFLWFYRRKVIMNLFFFTNQVVKFS